jgi:hypothetical protein
MGLTVDLDIMAKKKILSCQESEPGRAARSVPAVKECVALSMVRDRAHSHLCYHYDDANIYCSLARLPSGLNYFFPALRCPEFSV